MCPVTTLSKAVYYGFGIQYGEFQSILSTGRQAPGNASANASAARGGVRSRVRCQLSSQLICVAKQMGPVVSLSKGVREGDGGV